MTKEGSFRRPRLGTGAKIRGIGLDQDLLQRDLPDDLSFLFRLGESDYACKRKVQPEIQTTPGHFIITEKQWTNPSTALSHRP